MLCYQNQNKIIILHLLNFFMCISKVQWKKNAFTFEMTLLCYKVFYIQYNLTSLNFICTPNNRTRFQHIFFLNTEFNEKR